MILKNPTDNEITIGILGTSYTVEAQGFVEVSDQAGIAWRKIHAFLEVIETSELPEPPRNIVLEVISKESKDSEEVTEKTIETPTVKPVTRTVRPRTNK